MLRFAEMETRALIIFSSLATCVRSTAYAHTDKCAFERDTGDYLNGADTVRKKPKINLNTMTYHYDSEPDDFATVCRSV